MFKFFLLAVAFLPLCGCEIETSVKSDDYYGSEKEPQKEYSPGAQYIALRQKIIIILNKLQAMEQEEEGSQRYMTLRQEIITILRDDEAKND